MSENRKLTENVNVRMLPSLFNHLSQMAGDAGVSLPSRIREILVDAAGLDPAEAVTVKPQVRVTFPEDIQQLRGLRADLARLNGALVQAAIRCRETDANALHSIVEAAINDNKQIGRDIDQTLKRLSK